MYVCRSRPQTSLEATNLYKTVDGSHDGEVNGAGLGKVSKGQRVHLDVQHALQLGHVRSHRVQPEDEQTCNTSNLLCHLWSFKNNENFFSELKPPE